MTTPLRSRLGNAAPIGHRAATVRDWASVPSLFLGGCVLQEGTNLGRAGGCCGSTLRPASTAGSSRRCTGRGGVVRTGAGQVDRFMAVAVGDLRVGAFLKKIANEIRPARLRRDVKSRH